MHAAEHPTDQTASPRKLQRMLVRAMFGVFVVLLAAYVGIAAVASVSLSTPRRLANTHTPALLNLPYQDVHFPARGDGVSIAGWFMPRPSSSAAIVLVHGKDMNRAHEFDGQWLALAAALHQHGFAILMIDLRGHGASGAAALTFGLSERRDILGAVDWLRQQGFAPGSIGVLGVSMGAASAIGAAAEEAAIGALVADSGYAEIYPLIQEHWRAESGLPDIFLPGTLLIGSLLIGYDVTAARPVDEIGQIAPRPVLLIHGSVDQLVPVSHAYQLAAAASSAQLWEVPDAAHGEAYRTHPEHYIDRVARFFSGALR